MLLHDYSMQAMGNKRMCAGKKTDKICG